MPQGQLVAVLGRSGCGESAVLRSIAGMLTPTSGEVLAGGDRVAAPRRDVALMSQRLGGFTRRLAHELSGGMQQRVPLCRALIRYYGSDSS